MPNPLSLFELNQLIRSALDKNLDPSYWVIAEIGEMRIAQKGHCYLELVEKSGDKVTAKLRATIWSYTFRNLRTWFEGMTGQSMQPGLKILCNLAIQYHELYGLSANIKDIDANFTLGERAKKRQEILNRLVAEGVFEMNQSLALPTTPQRIAIISSPTAAGYGDFIDQIERNNYGYKFKYRLFKATMQGDSAGESIITALHQIHNIIDDFDLCIIIRGGGSQIDLDCFDNYELAAHIAQFPIPIVTGIGHERDETIADLVAHTKMKTPTAVAEFLIRGLQVFEEQLDDFFGRLYHLVNQRTNYQNQVLETYAVRLKAVQKESLNKQKSGLYHLTTNLRMQLKSAVRNHERYIINLQKTIELINPEHILKKGYSLTTVNGKKLAGQKVKKGDKMETITFSSKISSTVTANKYRNE